MVRLDQQRSGAAASDAGTGDVGAEALRTSVTISRTHADDVRQRQILARVDDGPTATLMYGDAVTRTLAPGAHVLRVNNTLFWKTIQFTIEPGEHLEFVAINRAGRMTLSFLAVMGVAPLYLTVERRSIA